MAKHTYFFHNMKNLITLILLFIVNDIEASVELNKTCGPLKLKTDLKDEFLPDGKLIF